MGGKPIIPDIWSATEVLCCQTWALQSLRRIFPEWFCGDATNAQQ